MARAQQASDTTSQSDMPVIFQHSQNELRFTIWGTICQDISNWEDSVDEMVFNEQLATGSYHGKFLIGDDERALMQQIKANGQIMPYYGVGGSHGACAYTIQCHDNGYLIRVENASAKESAEFDTHTNDGRERLLPRFRTWLAVNVRMGEVVKHDFYCELTGKSYRTYAHGHVGMRATP